ncbi:hypothetical protein ARMGADRAFT_96275 [Armillaria gallica]|uniref:Uncharacterized protein n=1 Tax=Armillaria gallica TaxID=47427 RepID=A0A2H3CFA8_ARMGA|nr:hypothetical protein ARMGADRAFT_96275 [Armillaria gallica]
MDVGQSTEVFCGCRMRREAVKRNVNARVNKFCEDGTCIAFGSTPAVSVPTLQSTPTRVTSRSPQVSTSAITEIPYKPSFSLEGNIRQLRNEDIEGRLLPSCGRKVIVHIRGALESGWWERLSQKHVDNSGSS